VLPVGQRRGSVCYLSVLQLMRQSLGQPVTS
jgi:hypothetical protein